MKVSEKDAAGARLAVDRIDALLPRMRADLTAAWDREIVAELEAERRVYDRLHTDMGRWQSKTYQRVAEMISVGLVIKNKVMGAWVALQGSIKAAYAHQGVRDIPDVRAWGAAANVLHENGGMVGGKPGDNGASTGAFQWNGPRRANCIKMFGHDPGEETMAENAKFLVW